MAGWYTYAILALGLLGTQRFLYKVSAERSCNTAWTTFSFMATVALLSVTLFVVLKESITNIQFLLFIAILNSGAFLLATLTHIEALKHIPSGVAYPVIRLNAITVVIFSIVYFKDRLTFYQVMGIVLAMAVLVISTRHFDDQNISSRNIKRGFIFMFISFLSGAIASISSKFAALYTNKMAFIAISYIVGTLVSFGLRKKLQTVEASRNHKDAIIIGLFMGLINFAGYYFFLKALSMGPLSIIASITGMHFVIAIILTALIYKEKLTSLRIIGISLSIFSIILLRF
jgi:drug/metabolite transporter (DMT)-like permease